LMVYKFEEKDVIFFWDDDLEVQSGVVEKLGEVTSCRGPVYEVKSESNEFILFVLEEHKLFATEREAQAAGWPAVRRMRQCFEAARTIVPGNFRNPDAVARLAVAIFNEGA